jgi:hypothetical protein
VLGAQSEESRREIEAVIDDIRDTQIVDDMFTKDDVEDIFENMKDAVGRELEAELERSSHHQLLYLRHLFLQVSRTVLLLLLNVVYISYVYVYVSQLQAEGSHVNLQLDVSKLDDAMLLQGIEQLQFENKMKNVPSGRNSKLQSLNTGGTDVKLVMQNKDLKVCVHACLWLYVFGLI